MFEESWEYLVVKLVDGSVGVLNSQIIVDQFCLFWKSSLSSVNRMFEESCEYLVECSMEVLN